jgi:hypothetical protein
MDHRKLRESETQYERAMNRYIKECDNHMKKEKEKKKYRLHTAYFNMYLI